MYEPVRDGLPGRRLAAPVLGILAIGQVVNVATGHVFLLLGMTGHQSLGAWAQLTVAAASVPLAIVLATNYGVTGAAVSYVITLTMVNVIWMGLVGRKVGVATTAIGVLRRRVR